jgi:hypothetical protein
MVSMDPERTELTWTFTPADLFEAPYEGTQPGAQLSITDGKAIVTVSGSQPVQPVEEELKQWVLGVLRVRSIQTGRSFELRGNATAAEFKNSKSNIFVRVEPAVIRMTAGRVDVVQTDASGVVVRDTRVERVASDQAEMNEVSKKALTNAVLSAMLESFVAALNDREGEFVRLYEIRDALVKHFGSDRDAREQLGVSSGDWSKFGRLANDAPVIEGRHRGRHPDALRPATAEERQTMHALAKEWIRKFAGSL